MKANLFTALYLLLIGMGVVFAALLALQGFVNGITLLDRGLSRLFSKKEEPPVEVVDSPPASEGISDEEAAVIAAAVTAAAGAPAIVHHVRTLRDESQENWSRVGRLDIMRSHSPSQKK